MMMYNNKNLTIRDTKKEDLDFIAANIREADKKEIYLATHLEPQKALDLSFKHSTICWTALYKNEPVAMFGCYGVPDSLDTVASIWMIGSTGMDKICMTICKEGKKVVNAFLSAYPFLYNYVSIENKKSIMLLKHLGARFRQPGPYGLDKALFQYFYFQETSHV